ncbi:MAG: hypothetical protein PHI12_10300 [Dehalococcoidales bacterium]|nr:hypothetical protein [Dehalococcoidales bacterium]
MRELPRTKRLEASSLYLIGETYREIEDKTGLSHGTVANVVAELRSGQLTIAGTPADQIEDLRQLALDLKGKRLTPAEARLGVTFYQRMKGLGITPETIETWTKLVKEVSSPDFPAGDFFETAARLHTLETDTGKPFQTLIKEYTEYSDIVSGLKVELDSLIGSREKLLGEMDGLSPQIETLEKKRGELTSAVVTQEGRFQELEEQLRKSDGQKLNLDRVMRELEQKNTRLSSQIGTKEETLGKIEQLGFSEEDLLRLKAFIEEIAKNDQADVGYIREKLFTAMATCKDMLSLEEAKAALAKSIKDLNKQEAILKGNVAALEQRRDILQGEVDSTIQVTSQQLQDLGQEAASQIQQQVDKIKTQIDSLIMEAVSTAESIIDMKYMVKQGEDSERDLDDFIREIKLKLGNNRL